MSLRCTDNVVYDAMMPQHNDMMAMDGCTVIYCLSVGTGYEVVAWRESTRGQEEAGRLALLAVAVVVRIQSGH